MIARRGQLRQDNQGGVERISETGHPAKTGNRDGTTMPIERGHLGQDHSDQRAGTGHLRQESQDRIVGRGQSQQNSFDKLLDIYSSSPDTKIIMYRIFGVLQSCEKI
jgi:hypothetical protein